MATRSLTRLLAPLVAVATLGAGLTGAPAHAAVDSPDGLTPYGETVGGGPVLSWNRVPGATSYDVQVATNPDFATVKYKVTTTNNQATPTVQLPAGDVWWRVQANSSTGDSGWSEAFFERGELVGPALLGPADGDVLDQPEDPALLSWEPVEGATSYTIEIDTADDFISPTTYSTKTASYVVPKPQIATIYHWRVRAVLAGGVVTSYSDDRTYSISGLEPPVLVSPGDTALASVEDVVLDWRPVVGATTYDLQVSTDANFNTIEHSRTGIRGTRYSPPETLTNDQYYWRVRPVDTLGNQLAWEAVVPPEPDGPWEFRRHWPDQAVLEHPADGDVVGDPFFYQWTGVDKASHYTVEISESNDFSNPIDSCTTVHTTYVPVGAGDCYPGAAGTYFWRVVALDAYGSSVNARTDVIRSHVGTFSYLPDMVDLASATPADGKTVQVPTLDWDPVPGAAEYKVFITATDGGSNSVNGVETASTTYTPRKALTPGKTYRWWVQTISADGRRGPGLVPEAQATFTVAPLEAATATTPDQLAPASGQQVGRFPGLTWQRVSGAAYYKVGIRPAGSIQAFTELSDVFTYGAGDVTAAKPLGTYEWIVNAYDADHAKIAVSAGIRSVTLVKLPDASRPRGGMTGLGIQEGRSCSAVLTDPIAERCENLRQTPVLRWDPVDGAGGYRLYLSRDKEMTNLVSGYPITVDSTMWTPTKALIDSQAGDAFYWEVQPCVTFAVCNPVAHAEWAFNKRSNPVELGSPANGSTVADDVTFEWGDFLETNQDVDDPGATDATGEHARIEARQYRVEVSTVPNFQSLVDKIEVDQTTYTAFAKAYPEGILYWRVSAIDGTGNVLTSSPTWQFSKSSDTPTATSPTGGSEVTQTEPFRWDPMPFASGYEIEVYRNGDLIGQPVNKVFSGSSKQAAFTTTTPLPVSETPYTWRVRRVDGSGNLGAWTSFESFRVTGAAPQLLTPTQGVTVAGNGALFTWQKVDGASAYRLERRAAGATSNTEVVTTPATSWAPFRTLGDGSWEWRVSTLDAAGKVTKSSGWARFVVDGTNPTVTRKTPTGRVGVGSSFVVKFSEPVTGVSTTSFRLRRKGAPDPVVAKVTVNAAGTKATLDPRRNLRRGRTYIVEVTSAVTDSAGNALATTRWRVTAR